MISKKTIKLANKIMKEFDQFNLIDNDSEDDVLVYRYMKGENYLEVKICKEEIETCSNLMADYDLYMEDIIWRIDAEEDLENVGYIQKELKNSVILFDKFCSDLSIKVDPIKLEAICSKLNLGRSRIQTEYDYDIFGAKIIIDIDEFDLELAKKVTEFLDGLKKPEPVSESLEQKCCCGGKCSFCKKETDFKENQKKNIENLISKIWDEIETIYEFCNKK